MLDWINYLEINDKYIGNDINKKCINFVFLWIRYNHYYNKKYPRKNYENERNQAKALDLDIVKAEYSHLKNEFLNSFKNLSTQEVFKTYIVNLKNDILIQFDDEHSNLDDFLETVYQIRCNLFHGDKLSRDYDAKIIAWAYDCLSKLLETTIFSEQ